MFTKGHFKVLADGRVTGAKQQRTYAPAAVSLSFPGCTLMLTVALDGDKLAPMLITQSRRAVQYNLPTPAQIRIELKSPDLQLPECPIVLCHTASTWNNANIHSRTYMPLVVLPKLQKCPPPEPNPVKCPQPPAPAVNKQLAAKIAAAKKHVPANKRALGSYGKDPIGGEVHDVFSGHISDETRKAYNKHQLFTSVVAARCTSTGTMCACIICFALRSPTSCAGVCV